MKWREDLNEVIDLGDKVRFRVFAEAENELSLSLDNLHYQSPNDMKSDVKGFDITINKVCGKDGQNFWVRESGFLANP